MDITLHDAGKKILAAVVVTVAAIAAPFLSVSGAICAIGLVLVSLVVDGLTTQHKLHYQSSLDEK